MPTLAAIRDFLTSYWTWLVAAVAACCACLVIGYAQGKSAEQSRCAAERVLASMKALETDAAASDAAAAERLSDALQIRENEEELVNAIAQVPDTAPDATRVRLGCQRLRAQGTDTSAIPACR